MIQNLVELQKKNYSVQLQLSLLSLAVAMSASPLLATRYGETKTELRGGGPGSGGVKRKAEPGPTDAAAELMSVLALALRKAPGFVGHAAKRPCPEARLPPGPKDPMPMPALRAPSGQPANENPLMPPGEEPMPVPASPPALSRGEEKKGTNDVDKIAILGLENVLCFLYDERKIALDVAARANLLGR